METLKEYFEKNYDNDYVKLANTVRDIALDYAKICLQMSLEGKKINDKAVEHVYILQLIAEAIENMREQKIKEV